MFVLDACPPPNCQVRVWVGAVVVDVLMNFTVSVQGTTVKLKFGITGGFTVICVVRVLIHVLPNKLFCVMFTEYTVLVCTVEVGLVIVGNQPRGYQMHLFLIQLQRYKQVPCTL